MAFSARLGRIDLRAPTVLDVDRERIAAETCNIGLGGVFVATRAPLFVGQRLPLWITLPDAEEPLLVEGEIRWIRAKEDDGQKDGVPGIGVRFVRPSLYFAAALDHFVRSHDRDG